MFPDLIWNETTGSAITVTVEGIWGGGAVPLNDEIWMDVEYLGNASYPHGIVRHHDQGRHSGGRNQYDVSSETWGGSTTAFKLVATCHAADEGADHGLLSKSQKSRRRSTSIPKSH